jgi:O-antigen ligase
VVAAIVGGAEVVRKQQDYLESQNVLSNRDTVWRTGLAALERYPWLGVGMGNYGQIRAERIREWRAQAGQNFDPAQYSNWGHGHSIYLNTLAERGLLGFGAFAAVALAWLFWLLRYRPRPSDEDLDWTLWGAAFSAWFVTFGVGAVNTTLHHEHAILAVLLLALWLSKKKSRAS